MNAQIVCKKSKVILTTRVHTRIRGKTSCTEPKTAKGGFTMDFEGYCVKCRKKQKIKNGSVGKTAKGRPVAKGTCPECGTKVNRFLPSKDAG